MAQWYTQLLFKGDAFLGDSLADLTWKGPQDLARIERSLEAAYDAAIETLSGAK